MNNLETFLAEVKEKPDGKAAQQFDYLLATKGMGWVCSIEDYQDWYYIPGNKNFSNIKHLSVDDWQPRTDLNQVAELIKCLGGEGIVSEEFIIVSKQPVNRVSGGREDEVFPVEKKRLVGFHLGGFPLSPYHPLGAEHDAMQCFRYLHATGKITDEDLIYE